jgi:hypothetical protein
MLEASLLKLRGYSLKKVFVERAVHSTAGGIRGRNKGFQSIRKFSGWRAEFREFSISEKEGLIFRFLCKISLYCHGQ